MLEINCKLRDCVNSELCDNCDNVANKYMGYASFKKK